MDNITSQKKMVLWALPFSIGMGVQAMIIVAVLSSLFLITMPAFIQKLYIFNFNDIRPEREILFYHVFVGTTLLAAFAMHHIMRRYHIQQIAPWFKTGIIVLMLGLGVQGFFVFKFCTGHDAIYRLLFLAALALTVMALIFLKEVHEFKEWCWKHKENFPLWINQYQVVIDCGVVIGIFLCLLTPDLNRVLARAFVVDNFYHFDGAFMASTFGYLSGLTLNVDMISQYSVVLPVIIAKLSALCGGLSYAMVIKILMALTIIYLIAFYALLRYCFKDVFIAIFGLVLFIKWNLFHWGVAPLIWMLAVVLPVRFYFDILILFLIWKDIHHAQEKYKWLMRVIAGVAMAYMLDTGTYISLTVLGYQFFVGIYRSTTWQQRYRLILDLVLGAITIGIVFMTTLYICVGPAILKPLYWNNYTEHIQLFLNGWGALPIYDGLKDKNFFAFTMGLLIPLTYIITVMVTSTMVMLRERALTWIFPGVVSIYGVLLYHYFIVRSALSSYYVVCMPFVVVLCFWIALFVKRYKPTTQMLIGLVLSLGAIGALLTNNIFAVYPNVLHTSDKTLSGLYPGSKELAVSSWKNEIDIYKKEFQFDQDVALIDAITPADSRVALISSFETAILMQAKRKPFFYYFPLITSRPMSMSLIGGTYLHTQKRLQRTLDQIEREAPAYVFIEKRIWNNTLPPAFLEYFETVRLLRDYLKQHYEDFKEGQYLIALKRR